MVAACSLQAHCRVIVADVSIALDTHSAAVAEVREILRLVPTTLSLVSFDTSHYERVEQEREREREIA